jgi:hypothetical protein
MHALGIDLLDKGIDGRVRKVGVDRQVMIPGELPAQVDKAGIEARFAPGEMKQPILAGGLEPFRPLDIRAVDP